MKLSYDYSELLKELRDELADGTLTLQSDILVLRGSPISSRLISEFKEIADARGENVEYRPIVDWYYDDLQIEKVFAKDPFDSNKEIKEKILMREQFSKDRPNMKIAKVRDVIAEMEEWGRIL